MCGDDNEQLKAFFDSTFAEIARKLSLSSTRKHQLGNFICVLISHLNNDKDMLNILSHNAQRTFNVFLSMSYWGIFPKYTQQGRD